LKSIQKKYPNVSQMEYADPEVEPLLLERIRAVVPSIRTTPHGRRIAAKVQARDQRHADEARLAGANSSTSFQAASKAIPSMTSSGNTASQPNSHSASRQNSQPTSRAASRPVSRHESTHPMIPISNSNISQGYPNGINGYTAGPPATMFASSTAEPAQFPTSNASRGGFSQRNPLNISAADQPSISTQPSLHLSFSPQSQQSFGTPSGAEGSNYPQSQPAGFNGANDRNENYASYDNHAPQAVQGDNLQKPAPNGPNGFTFF
jgi:hypothetical protein